VGKIYDEDEIWACAIGPNTKTRPIARTATITHTLKNLKLPIASLHFTLKLFKKFLNNPQKYVWATY
jgi:hypothetical protein